MRRTIPQAVMVVEIFIAQRQCSDALPQQLGQEMFYVSLITHASEVTATETCGHFASIMALKLKKLLPTACECEVFLVFYKVFYIKLLNASFSALCSFFELSGVAIVVAGFVNTILQILEFVLSYYIPIMLSLILLYVLLKGHLWQVAMAFIIVPYLSFLLWESSALDEVILSVVFALLIHFLGCAIVR